MTTRRRVVFDCNVFLQALANPDGPAGRCVQLALDGLVELFISAHILEEVRRVTAYPKTRKKLRIRDERVDALLLNLPKVSTLVLTVPDAWRFSRDPDDAHYVNLALACDARLIVSRDKDLLELSSATSAEAVDLMRRFPDFRVVTPNEFLILHASSADDV